MPHKHEHVYVICRHWLTDYYGYWVPTLPEVKYFTSYNTIIT